MGSSQFTRKRQARIGQAFQARFLWAMDMSGHSIKSLAKAMGKDVDFVADMLRADVPTRPDRRTLYKLARVFDLSPHWLCGDNSELCGDCQVIDLAEARLRLRGEALAHAC